MIIKRQGKVVDTEKAIESHLQHTDYYTRGESREALEVAQQCAKAIGVLAAAMERHNLLTVRDVQNLVGSDCEVLK